MWLKQKDYQELEANLGYYLKKTLQRPRNAKLTGRASRPKVTNKEHRASQRPSSRPRPNGTQLDDPNSEGQKTKTKKTKPDKAGLRHALRPRPSGRGN